MSHPFHFHKYSIFCHYFPFLYFFWIRGNLLKFILYIINIISYRTNLSFYFNLIMKTFNILTILPSLIIFISIFSADIHLSCLFPYHFPFLFHRCYYIFLTLLMITKSVFEFHSRFFSYLCMSHDSVQTWSLPGFKVFFQGLIIFSHSLIFNDDPVFVNKLGLQVFLSSILCQLNLSFSIKYAYNL